MKIAKSLSTKIARSITDSFRKHYSIWATGVDCTVTGAGNYVKDSIIHLRVTPSEHYHFSHWSDGNTDPIRAITVTEDLDLVAYCVLDSCQITYSSLCTVTVQSAAIPNGSYVPYGTSVIVNVFPPEGLFAENEHYSLVIKEDTNIVPHIFSAVKLTPIISDDFTVSAIGEVEFSVDGAKWNDLSEFDELTSDDALYLRGNVTKLYITGAPVEVSGHLAALSQHPARLFENTTVYDASQLHLPSVTEPYQYQAMFKDCVYLTSPCALPEGIERGCFQSMFEGCDALTYAPHFEDYDLKPWCYAYMFARCTSLRDTVYLPAHRLVPHCYEHMFTLSNAKPICPYSVYEYYKEEADKAKM